MRQRLRGERSATLAHALPESVQSIACLRHPAAAVVHDLNGCLAILLDDSDGTPPRLAVAHDVGHALAERPGKDRLYRRR